MTQPRGRLLALLLTVTASVVATVPWLRSFPSSVGAAPFYGAAALSVVLPSVTARFTRGPRLRGSLLVAVAIDCVGLLAYLLVVVLHGQGGLHDVGFGLLHGPSQLLTFALPLVSPRTLLVAPTAMIWLAGALGGECLARRRVSVAPQLGFFVAFGLAYTATLRATTGSAAEQRLRDSLLAASLLACLLLLRATQVWSDDADIEAAPSPTKAPLHRRPTLLAGGAALAAALVVAIVAGFTAQSAIFGKRSVVPQRAPSVQTSAPLTPLAFIANLRPSTAAATRPVFTLTTDAPIPGYIGIANLDTYDGAGWSFDRGFLPSGGVLPTSADAATADTRTVTQDYEIDAGALTAGPWIPSVDRAERVTGIPVNIDPTTAMIVSGRHLSSADAYTVQSAVLETTFDHLDTTTAQPDVATPATDIQLAPTLRGTIAGIVTALSSETGVSTADPLAFLKAVQADIREHYALVASGSTPTSGTPTSGGPTAAPSGTARAGGTGFSDVLASILGAQRTATPEQYATLVALLARQLGVPARVETGFRIAPATGQTLVPAGRYSVTTAQAWSWAEVAISGSGWVVLDASPSSVRNAPTDVASGAAATPTPSATPTGNALITTGNAGNAVARQSPVEHDRDRRQVLLLVILIVAVVLATALVVVLLGRKRLRAGLRRRRSRAPRDRLSGAWDEALDRLVEAGLTDSATLDVLTGREITVLTEDRFGGSVATHTGRIGTAAETATFRASVPVQVAEADAAWIAQHDLVRALNRELGLRRRIIAATRYRRYRGRRARRRQH